MTGYAPDFTNLPFMQASRDALRDIRAGIGKAAAARHAARRRDRDPLLGSLAPGRA